LGAKQIRYLLGVVLVLFVAGVLALDAWLEQRLAGSAILVVMGLVGYLEYSKMATGRALGLQSLPGFLATAWFLGLACWDWGTKGFVPGSGEQELVIVGVFALVLFSFLAVLFRSDFVEGAGRIARTVLGAVLCGLFFSFMIRIYCRSEDVLTGAVFVFGVKLTDIGGYVAGSTIGRVKFLKVSPNKTLEGFLAGFVLVAAWFGLAANSGYVADLKFGWLPAIALGIILAFSAVIGDLSESLIKRLYGVKDSGSLLPEFGGVLDIIDSFIFSGFVFWYLLPYWS
tara:strand:+ start:912 stop:1763 length:852 start_codon:yes stop_codon:yes gene_type:complete